jgi:hypothetical protein
MTVLSASHQTVKIAKIIQAIKNGISVNIRKTAPSSSQDRFWRAGIPCHSIWTGFEVYVSFPLGNMRNFQSHTPHVLFFFDA